MPSLFIICLLIYLVIRLFASFLMRSGIEQKSISRLLFSFALEIAAFFGFYVGLLATQENYGEIQFIALLSAITLFIVAVVFLRVKKIEAAINSFFEK